MNENKEELIPWFTLKSMQKNGRDVERNCLASDVMIIEAGWALFRKIFKKM